MSIRVICINDSDKPNEIPQSKWIEQGKQYHITWVYKQMQQRGLQGVELKEIDLSGCFPYNCFSLNRFAIHEQDIPELIQLMKEATDLNEIELRDILSDIDNDKDKGNG